MSGTDRKRIDNPRFFGNRGQARNSPARVRLVPQYLFPKERVPKRQSGFTYLALMIVIAVMGAGLAAVGELYSHAAQREKEQELLFAGHQFRQAIASYYDRSPGAKVYPKTLEDLLEDKRFPMPQHHLRKLYVDPMTGAANWALVQAPGGGGIMGVHSASEDRPIKSAGFDAADEGFDDADAYAKWTFVYKPVANVRR